VASLSIKEEFSRLSRVKVCYVNLKFLGLFHILMYVFLSFQELMNVLITMGIANSSALIQKHHISAPVVKASK